MTQHVYGKNVVKQPLQDGKPIHEVLIQKGIRDTALEGEIKKRRALIEVSGRKGTDQLLNGNHQGIAVCIDDYRTQELEELLENTPRGRQPPLMMLDDLEGPHNLGAILRTYDCVQVDDVIIGKHRNVRLTPMVVGVSTGATDTVKVNMVTNLAQAIRYPKKQGYWVVGTDSENSRNCCEGQYDVPLVLVIGNEDFGISSLVRENCNYCVRLPVEGSVSSLNASMAAGTLLYQIHAQRHPL